MVWRLSPYISSYIFGWIRTLETQSSIANLVNLWFYEEYKEHPLDPGGSRGLAFRVRWNCVWNSIAGQCRTNLWPAVPDWPWCRNADNGVTASGQSGTSTGMKKMHTGTSPVPEWSYTEKWCRNADARRHRLRCSWPAMKRLIRKRTGKDSFILYTL